MNAYAPPLWKFWTVVTLAGLRFSVWARCESDAIAKVHGATGAWVGVEPAGNDRRVPS